MEITRNIRSAKCCQLPTFKMARALQGQRLECGHFVWYPGKVILPKCGSIIMYANIAINMVKCNLISQAFENEL